MKNQLTVNELLQGIEESYRNYFTDSKCIAKLNTNLYSSISVKCLLANNRSEVANGYYENDMFNIAFMIDAEGKEFSKDITIDSVLPDNLQISIIDKGYLIKPDNKYMCYGSRKLNFRKTKGDPAKLLKVFDKWFSKLYEELKNDIANDNIHSEHINLLNEKLI